MALRFSLEISILNRVLGVEVCRGSGEVKGRCVCVVGESEFLLLLNEMAVDLGFFLAKTGAGPRGGDDDDGVDNDLKSTTSPSLDSRVRGGKLEEM